MTNYLITGSSGFIGRHLCAQLHNTKNFVRAVSRSGDRVAGVDQHLQGDLLAEKLPAEFLQGTDVLFHLAGLAHQPGTHGSDSQPYFDLNRDTTLALARAANAAGVKKFVFISSVKAARYDCKHEPNDETVTALPDDAYGLSKREAEEALRGLPSANMEIIIVRPSLVYGAGVKGNLRRMMRAIRSGWFPAISGGGMRSMVSVHDLCVALISLTQADGVSNQPYIVTDGQRYTIERIGSAIRAAMGKQGRALSFRSRDLYRVAGLNDAIKRRVGIALPFNKSLVDKLCGSEWYSAVRLQAATGWRPSQTLEDQLPVMVQYMEASHE